MSINANTKSGVALYLAIVVGTILISTGLGLSGIFFREVRISRLQFPSVVSFYAADAGQECALYHDLDQDIFNGVPPATIQCQGNSISLNPVGTDKYHFAFNLSNAVDACADVTIKKETINILPFGNTLCTRIDSYGENGACGSGAATVQRGILTIYPESCIGLINP